MAKEYGASVEAELGSMGRRESGSGKGDSSLDDTKIYTDPAQAKAFVEETEIDALACSFGTTHGIYLSEPKLDFEIVKRVREQTQNIPVVMHGGSGIRREDYRKAICAGVRKINYFTYMDQSGGVAVSELLKKMAPEEKISFSTLSMKARDAMKYDIKEVMKVFAMTDQHR